MGWGRGDRLQCKSTRSDSALKITRHMPQRHEGGNDGDDADADGDDDNEALMFRALILSPRVHHN